MAFKPALLVIDMQNDYCTPGAGCPVSGDGRDLVAPIKQLLSMPGFAMRITTVHEVPENHKAMAHNITGAKPWETFIDFPNPKQGKGHETEANDVEKMLFARDLGSKTSRWTTREQLRSRDTKEHAPRGLDVVSSQGRPWEHKT